MNEDLRSFLDLLSEMGCLAEVSKEVDPCFEVSGVMRAAEREGKALYFKNIKGSAFPMVTNLFCSRKVMAKYFKTSSSNLVTEFTRRLQNPIKPRLVTSSRAKEVVLTGADIDLTTLPIITHRGKDAGPYITAGIITAKDPQTGIRNVSVNRMQLKGKDKLGVRMMPPQHLGVIFKKYEKIGKNMPVAVAIGAHPVNLISAATSVPFGVDEFSIAGALRGAPIELTACETVDIEVPASAQIIIEGEVICGMREAEGPFGDFLQYYVPVMNNNVFHVKAITMRMNPIYQTIQAGSVEDTNLLALSREAKIYDAVSKIADVHAVALLPTILGGAISIHKTSEEQVKLVLAAAFKAYSWLKYCVVVDHDVDVFNPDDVWWAVATRSRLETGLLNIDNSVGFQRDPFRVHTSKIGIDATAPLNQWNEFERIDIPRFNDISLKDYLT